jgi:hypothetical protein
MHLIDYSDLTRSPFFLHAAIGLSVRSPHCDTTTAWDSLIYVIGWCHCKKTPCWVLYPMELRQLLHFVALAEEESFTRAARRTHIVQSALSTSIRLLEEELGAKLFIRSTRQVRVTAVGQAFLEKAHVALQALKQGNWLAALFGGYDAAPHLALLVNATLPALCRSSRHTGLYRRVEHATFHGYRLVKKNERYDRWKMITHPRLLKKQQHYLHKNGTEAVPPNRRVPAPRYSSRAATEGYCRF